ncbi:MAG: hypothetical protein JWP03_1705 [Phycisphaerales bacterium]|nr:hypothetical protein [Phycisphaerales bacterium]
MHNLEVQSAWGAVAAVVLLQCLGAILINALLYHLGPGMLPCEEGVKGHLFVRLVGKIIFSFWGLGWICTFFYCEVLIIKVITRFFDGNGVGALAHLKHPLSAVKLLLALVFARMLFLLHHDYPFPRPRGRRLVPLFLLGSFMVSTYIADHHQMNGGQIADGPACILGLLLGLLFFAVGCAEPHLFYLAGVLGSGIVVLMTCSMLLERDRVSIDGLFLCAAATLLVLWQIKHVRVKSAQSPA